MLELINFIEYFCIFSRDLLFWKIEYFFKSFFWAELPRLGIYHGRVKFKGDHERWLELNSKKFGFWWKSITDLATTSFSSTCRWNLSKFWCNLLKIEFFQSSGTHFCTKSDKFKSLPTWCITLFVQISHSRHSRKRNREPATTNYPDKSTRGRGFQEADGWRSKRTGVQTAAP